MKFFKFITPVVRFATLALLTLSLAGLSTGCTTSAATQANPAHATIQPAVDLNQYRIVTVMPFAVTAGDKVDPLVGTDFADDVYERLRNSFAGIFDQVRKGPVLGTNGELIVTGTIKTYNPGSRAGRALLIGVGAASFAADLTLKDGQNNQVLMTAPIDKLWAWGGAAGASKGIENMVAEAAATAAATIAHAKGWRPPLIPEPGK